MATLTQRTVTREGAERWELRDERPLLVRIARPWLKNPVGLLGLAIVVVFLFLGLLGPYLAPQDPRDLDVTARTLSPSLEHPFGTTTLGQDMFSRAMAGARISLIFGTAILVFGFLPGTLLGIASGYFGRWIDYAIQRSGEAWTAFPQLPILLTVIAAVGPGLTAVVVVIAIGGLFGGSRLLRAVALVERHKDYVLAAQATGGSEWHIFWRHILPNVMPYILVGASSIFAVAVLAEAALSFLGLGLEPGEPGWGNDLNAALDGGRATSAPHLVIFPGLMISVTVLGFNLMGDTLRDILDPRLRGSQ